MDATATAPAPQHMRALAQANRVRLARAELKRQVAEGETTVAEIVLECPWEAESMAIADLLLSQHRWGRTRCRRFLAAIPHVGDEDGRLDDRAPAPRAGGPPERRHATTRRLVRARRAGRAAPRSSRAAGGPPVRRAYADGPPAGKPGPLVAISTMCPSGSRR